MPYIRFKNVGRNKWTGIAEIPTGLSADGVAEAAYRVAAKHLMSRFPDVEYDSDANEGIIMAGFHTVGTFTVEASPSVS